MSYICVKFHTYISNLLEVMKFDEDFEKLKVVSNTRLSFLD